MKLEQLWQWVESFIPNDKDKGHNRNQSTRIRSEQAELRAAQFKRLCEELGQPQHSFRSIHVAGSKGKGQTASYIAYGLAALGQRVGLFSSPHIHSYSERIQVLQRSADIKPKLPELPVGVNKIIPSVAELFPQFSPQWQEIRQEVISVDISKILCEQGALLQHDFARFSWAKNNQFPIIAGESQNWILPNFFAILTLLAFRSFAAAGCDWVVLETGIGGRLCPTNVVDPALSVITPIELEHTDILGESLELIAAEKAGIIKAGRPCVVSRQHSEVEAVLQKYHHQSPMYFLQDCLTFMRLEELDLDLDLADTPILQLFLRPRKLYWSLTLDLKEYYHGELLLRAYSSTQVDNLILAVLALQVLKHKVTVSAATEESAQKLPRISPNMFHSQLLSGIQSSLVPGRFSSYWFRNCLLLFDGAHTPVSCKRLLQDIQSYLKYQTIQSSNVKSLKFSLLFAAVQGKNFAEMAHILAPNFHEIVLTRAGTFKQNNLPVLEQAFRSALVGNNITYLFPIMEKPHQALRVLLNNSPDLLLICGSFYLLGELLPGRQKENWDIYLRIEKKLDRS